MRPSFWIFSIRESLKVALWPSYTISKFHSSLLIEQQRQNCQKHSSCFLKRVWRVDSSHEGGFEFVIS
jgi:hypothetical protein